MEKTFSVTGTPSYSFGTATVGNGKTITTTGFTAPSSNYSITQPSLTGNITQAALTVTANNANRTYGGATLTGAAGSTAFTTSGLQNSETVGTVTIAYTSGSGNGNTTTDTVGTYTGTVTPSAATGGSFTASNYSITYNAGDIIVNAGAAGSWLGFTSTDFNTASNWAANAVPSSSDNITVTTASNYPVLAGNTTVANLNLASGTTLDIAGNTLTLNGTVSGTGSLVGSNTSKLTLTNSGSIGTIYLDQTTSADVSTTTGTNALQNLVVSGGGSVTLGNKVNLFNRLSVSSGTLATGGNLVLRSTATNTAYVDQVGGTISGQVTVERYIHKQGRGWRALTAPITYNGITQGYVSGNWQSAFGYSGNYGTRITGPDTLTAGNGIDNYSNSASMQTYNSTTGAWTKVLNTNTQTQSGNSGNADNKGFFVFVRGDRTVFTNQWRSRCSTQ